MAAIRAAGGKKGAKLRSVEAAKRERKLKRREEEETKQASSSSKGGGGGDLMGDLAKALSLRRKGITGTKKIKSGQGILGEMMAALPPPTSTTPFFPNCARKQHHLIWDIAGDSDAKAGTGGSDAEEWED